MKFSIYNVEAHVDENVLLIGERILERANFEVVKIDRNLWIAKVENFEVEVQMVADKVKAFSCECDMFEHSKICGHTAAVLFALRRKFAESKKANETQTNNRAQSLTVNHILNVVPADDLKAFLRQYSRKNRLFGIVLKVRFASAIPTDDTKAKYNELLDIIFKYLIGRNGNISPQGVHHLAGFIELLNNQIEDAIALEDYAEAFDILSVVIGRLLHNVKKCGQNFDELKSTLAATTQILKILSSKNLSPELKLDIWDFSRSFYTKSSAKILGIAGQLLSIAMAVSNEKSLRVELMQSFSEELKKKHPLEHKLDLLNSVLPYLNRDAGCQEAMCDAIQQLSDYSLLVRMAEQLMTAGLPELSIEAAKQALKIGLPVDLYLSVRRTMLAASEKLHSADDVFENALWLYHETLEPQYFKACKAVIGKVSEQRIEHIAQAYQFSPADFLRLTLHALQENWKELFGAIAEKDRIDITLKFAHPLHEGNPMETKKLLQAQMDRYLKSHFGPVPAKQIAKWLKEIEMHVGKKLSDQLKDFVRKSHPSIFSYMGYEF